MRAPNGYGTVAKLKGNRRNPFVVRKTKGWSDKGYPIYDVIGYYPTREAGMIALAQYNNDPWDLETEKTTFEELYELWEEKKAHKLGKSNRRSLKSVFSHCARLHKMKYKGIKAYHMQECIDGCGKGYATQATIKNLLGHINRFAIEMDIVTHCYADLLTSEPIVESDKIPFTEDEIKRLWEIESEPWVDSILVFLYTGFRLSELLDIKSENVDLKEGTLKGGMKTRSGKDRIVPIHSRIAKIVSKRLSEGHEYLFTINGRRVYSYSYYAFWNTIMEQTEMKHTPHETRHTFRSRLDSAGANKRCIDLIMGHKSKDVGERVYTHKTIQELKATIELLE